MALGRFVLQPSDDLSLAALLKSPLFGWDDDRLFTLAYPRGAGDTLLNISTALRAMMRSWRRFTSC